MFEYLVLNSWHSLGGLGGVAFVAGTMSSEVGFETLKGHFKSALCFLLAVQDVSTQFLLQVSHLLLAVMLPRHGKFLPFSN